VTLWESQFRHLSEGTEENHEDTRNIRYDEATFESRLGRREAGVLLTQPLISINSELNLMCNI
jgi:hypothetical protein